MTTLTTPTLATALTPTSPRISGGDRERSAGQRSFLDAIAKANDGVGTPRERARAAAEQLVATTFIAPILKEAREAAAKVPPPFGPGEGEKQFRALGDARLADRLARAANWGIVDRIASDLLAKGGERA